MSLERAAARALGIEPGRYPESSEPPVVTAAGAITRMNSSQAPKHPEEIRGAGCPVGGPIQRAPHGSKQELVHRRAVATTFWVTESKEFMTTASVRLRLLRFRRGADLFRGAGR
jgi:hypothetical protein